MKKLFTNNKYFITSFLITAAAFFALIVLIAVQSTYDFLHYEWLTDILFLACEIAMFVSFRNHNKNLMKGMIGATLMAEVMDALYWDANPENGSMACAVLSTIVTVLLFIVHFSVNSDRHSNPNAIKVNMRLFFVFVVIEVIWFVCDVKAGENVVYGILVMLSQIGLLNTVVCIEAKLDAFRIDRETAGWSEDKGYPEGYVHEYQKTSK